MISGFLLSLLLSRATLAISSRVGVMDMPDFGRKLNTSPVPRLGGVAFFTVFFALLPAWQVILSEEHALLPALMCGGGLSLLFGAADDFFNLRPIKKLLLQALTAAVTVALLPSYSIHPTVAFFFIVLMMNAYNLSDGIDGLCVGLSLSSLLFLSIRNLLLFNTGCGQTPLLLFFSLLGFLPFNAHPARLYMGESGSATLGFSIAIFTISTPSELVLPSALFSFLPLFDALLAFIRRPLSGRSPFAADREHLHHKLIDRGLSCPAAAGALSLLSILISSVALFLVFFIIK